MGEAKKQVTLLPEPEENYIKIKNFSYNGKGCLGTDLGCPMIQDPCFNISRVGP